MFFQKHPVSPSACLLILVAIAGLCCTRYYIPVKANTSTPEATGNIIKENAPNKYFILRQGATSYALKNITVDNTGMTLNGTLFPVDNAHLKYINTTRRDYKYKKAGKADSAISVLNEIHIYSKSKTPVDITKSFSLPLDQIDKIEVIGHDAGRTTTSYILGGVGITLGIAVVAAVIVALTKDSCPFVSVYDGEKYSVQGELFGGAVNRNLERLDYLPLNIQPVNGEFQLRISNELKEKQYTNFADLVVLEHDKYVQAGIDVNGKIYLAASPQAPVAAFLNDNRDVLKTVSRPDGKSCNFDDTLVASPVNELTLSFTHPQKVTSAKLILQLKNSYWLDYLFGEFTSHFGKRYDHWKKKQNSQPAEKMIQWTRDQEIPLSVYVSTITGWKEVLKLNTIGPLTNRQVVIPIELNNQTSDPIRVRLSAGFKFWELDYAAMDFTADEQVTITKLSPYYAVDEKGNDVLKQLTGKDAQYLSQTENGNYATLRYKFNKTAGPGKSYSVVFVTSGYYLPVREYKGKPDIAFLKSFREPGAMSRFSKNRYQSIIRYQSVIALKTK